MRTVFLREAFYHTLVAFLLMMGGSSVAYAKEPILPIPHKHGQDMQKAALGDRLFHDPRLSSDNTVSCASCHSLPAGGDDDLPRSFGVKGAEGNINSPTVFNTGFNLAQFWDGRAKTLAEQVDGPIHNPVEMAASWPQVVAKLRKDAGYVKAFQALYQDGLTSTNIKDAIATFERTLTTPGSSFDRWLEGNAEALTVEEKKGYGLFKAYGCIACHQGVNVGGNMYQTMGAFGDYFADREAPVSNADLGRFHVTGKEGDRFVFKVPSLRLVAKTAPYFHDGQTETLEEAVEIMGRYQLGRSIPEKDLKAIVAFLHTLAGEHSRLK